MISVLVETSQIEPGSERDLVEFAHAMNRLEYPSERLEVVAAVMDETGPVASALRAARPDIKLAVADGDGYFEMKRAAFELAEGDVLAFLDTDCIPAPDWARRIEQSMQRGADVVAGRTRYPREVAFSRTMTLYSFGVVSGDRAGNASSFVANNAAVRREALTVETFEGGLRRSGAEYLMARRLRRQGYRVVYDPNQMVVHEHQGYRTFVRNRVRAGFDAVNVPRFDRDRVLPETRLARLGLLAPVAVWAARVFDDWKRILRHRRTLDIRAYELPYFWLTSPPVRAIEIVGGMVGIVRPEVLQHRYRW